MANGTKTKEEDHRMRRTMNRAQREYMEAKVRVGALEIRQRQVERGVHLRLRHRQPGRRRT